MLLSSIKIPFPSVSFCFIPFSSVSFRLIPSFVSFRSFRFIPFYSVSFRFLLFHSVSLRFLPFHFIPFRSVSPFIPFHTDLFRFIPLSNLFRLFRLIPSHSVSFVLFRFISFHSVLFRLNHIQYLYNRVTMKLFLYNARLCGLIHLNLIRFRNDDCDERTASI